MIVVLVCFRIGVWDQVVWSSVVIQVQVVQVEVGRVQDAGGGGLHHGASLRVVVRHHEVGGWKRKFNNVWKSYFGMHDESTFRFNSVFWNIEFPKDLFSWVNIDWNDFIDWIPNQYCTNNKFTAQKTVLKNRFYQN